MWNVFKTATADTTECVRVTIPYGNWAAGAIVRLRNLTPERRSWIADLLRRSEPCADPGADDLVTILDVAGLNPAPMDFNRPEQEPLTRPQLRARLGLTDDNVNFAMDLKLLARATPQFHTKPKPPVAEGLNEFVREPGVEVDVVELWSVRDVEKFEETVTRLFPRALAR